jgi:hypothetical protein
MDVTVVSLCARAELARAGQEGMDIDVHEFAVLDDGRRLTLHQERGFSTSATRLTADQAERDVLTTVLPDDAEITGEYHPWEWLASLVRKHAVAVTPEQLKTIPYTVEFGPRLAALLASQRQQLLLVRPIAPIADARRWLGQTAGAVLPSGRPCCSVLMTSAGRLSLAGTGSPHGLRSTPGPR